MSLVMEGIKCCPHCNKPGKLAVTLWEDGEESYSVICSFSDCKVFPLTNGYETEEQAIVAWNEDHVWFPNRRRAMRVEFNFEIDQKVQTMFGSLGVIRMLAYDKEGIQYSVLTEKGHDWFREDEITLDKE